MLKYISRLLSILLVAFFGVFILEGFNEDFGIIDSLSHLLPALAILFISLISWKWSKIGGWFFVVLGLFFMYFFSPFIWTGLLVGGVVLLTGSLFVLEGFKVIK